MRSFLWFLATILGTLLIAALLAYPAYMLLHPWRPDWWFDRIGGRIWEFLLLPAGLVVVVRHLRLTRRDDYGYGAPRPRWLRQFRIGLVAGVLTMLPVSLSMLMLGARTLLPDLSPAHALGAMFAGLGSGLAVGFVEETFFRGLLQGAVLRDTRQRALGIVLVAVLFAALHFLGHVHIAHADVTWHSGIDLLAAVAGNFTAPGAIIDAFLSLAAVGLVLGTITAWTGNIGAAVGLHAGWVWMMRATVGMTRPAPDAAYGWLVSRTDGYTGWLVLGWTLLILLAGLAFGRSLRRALR